MVSWGGWEYGSGNGMRVGLEVTVQQNIGHNAPDCWVNVEYWTENQYTYGDDQSLNLGGAIGGSIGYRNGQGGAPVKRGERVLDYNYGPNEYKTDAQRSFSATVNGAFNGVTPSKTVTVNIPDRPYAAPASPSSQSVVRVSDETNQVRWNNRPTAGEPYSGVRVERYIYGYGGYAGVGWTRVATLGATTEAYNDASATPNRKYTYRIEAYNGVGDSGYTPNTNILYTTPATPSSCVRTELSSTSQRINWNSNVNYAEHQTQVFQCVNGVWDSTPIYTAGAADGAQSYTHTIDPTKKYKYRVRAKTSSGTALYSSYSGETTESAGDTNPPNPPTLLVPTANTVMDGTEPIVLSWKHNATDGKAQVKYEVQHREVGGSWVSTGEKTVTTASHTLPPTYSHSKTVEWQVRTWGTDPGPSDWSATATFKTAALVPVKYPVYLDLTSGRLEALSTGGTSGGPMQTWEAAASTFIDVVTSSLVDIPGCTVTVPSTATTDKFLVVGAGDLQWLSGSGAGTVRLSVDGTYQSVYVIGTAGASLRFAGHQQWLITGLAPGDHVFKFGGAASSGSWRVGTNTKFTVVKLEGAGGGGGGGVGVTDGDKGDITVSGSGLIWNIDPGAVGSTEIAVGAIYPTHMAATGTKDATTYLRGDNVWAAPPGGVGGSMQTWEAAVTSNIIVTGTTVVPLTGCSVVVPVTSTTEKFLVVEAADMIWQAGAGYMYCELYVDGVAQTGRIGVLTPSTALRSSGHMNHVVTGLSPGNHTFEFRGWASAAATSWQYNAPGTRFSVVKLASSGNPVTLIPTTQVITANGTWTKPAKLAYIEVEMVGGGGGGGGAATAATGQGSAGAGGGGGGYSRKTYLAADLSATENVVVGQGGSAGAANAGDGGNATASTFKGMTANGGLGGQGMVSSGTGQAPPGQGNSGTGGDLNISGGDGEKGLVQGVGATGGVSGIDPAMGGSSQLGGSVRVSGVGSGSGTGLAGKNYGGGAGGGYNRAGGTAQAGGLGADGVVIITSYVENPVDYGPPVGSMMMWPVAVPPAKYLLCDGAAIPAQYATLIALIGPNTPDLRVRLPVGAGTGVALGSNDGLTEDARSARLTHIHAVGTLATGTTGSGHTHDASSSSHSRASNMSIGGSSVYLWDTDAGRTHTHSITSTGSGHTHNVTGSTAVSPALPTYGVNYVIKAE